MRLEFLRKECSTKKIDNNYLTQSCHENSSSRNILSSLAIRFKKPGYYSICAQLATEVLDLTSECVNFNVEDGLVHSHHGTSRYKPLFIVLMYLLCAILLAAISFGKFALNRHKLASQKRTNHRAGIKSQSEVLLYRTDGIENSCSSIQMEEKAAHQQPLLYRIESACEFETEKTPRVLFKVSIKFRYLTRSKNRVFNRKN